MRALLLVHEQAFAMIDQNRDGIIDVEDLAGIYAQLGKCVGSMFPGSGISMFYVC